MKNLALSGLFADQVASAFASDFIDGGEKQRGKLAEMEREILPVLISFALQEAHT